MIVQFNKSVLTSAILTGVMCCFLMACDNTPDIKVSDTELFSTEWWQKATVQDVKSLIKQKIDFNRKSQERYNMSIFNIAASNTSSSEIIELLIKGGAKINERDNLGGSALLGAALTSYSPEVIKILIKKGADVNATTNEGSSVLSFILRRENPNLDVVNLLIKKGVDINKKDNMGATPLLIASAENKNPDAIKILLKNGANINTANSKGVNALIAAALQNPNLDIIQFLIDNGADIYMTNDNGINALSLSGMNPNPMVFKIIQQQYFKNLNEKEKTTVCIGYMGGIMGRNDKNVEDRFMMSILSTFHRKYGEDAVDMSLLLSARPLGLNTNISKQSTDIMNTQCNPLLRDLNKYSLY